MCCAVACELYFKAQPVYLLSSHPHSRVHEGEDRLFDRKMSRRFVMLSVLGKAERDTIAIPKAMRRVDVLQYVQNYNMFTPLERHNP